MIYGLSLSLQIISLPESISSLRIGIAVWKTFNIFQKKTYSNKFILVRSQ